jgi:CP family cyanate transporter-like MFS transporter
MQGIGFMIAGSMPFIAGQLRTLTDHFTSVGQRTQLSGDKRHAASDHKTDTLHKRHQPRTCLRLTDHFTSVWLLQATVTLVLIVLNLRFHPRSYPQA